MLNRLRDLIVDGLLLAVPLVVVWVLLQRVVDSVATFLAPVVALMPLAPWTARAAADLLALLLIFLGLVTIGAFTRTAPGRRTFDWIERVVLRKVPGYLLYKSILTGFATEDPEAGFTAALVAFDENTVLAFIVEPATAVHDMVTVFVPSAPNPTSGSVLLVPSSRVTLLSISSANAIHMLTRLGRGLQQFTQSGAP